MDGEHGLPTLIGVTTAPLLSADGAIRAGKGYDPTTQLYCSDVPDIAPMTPMTPMRSEAEAGLRFIRDRFKTFPFADAIRKLEASRGVEVVDQGSPPGEDESALILGLMTAVCRPSLALAPGLLITAPAISGAGSGKGLLARAVSIVAFGTHPKAFTPGSERHELDKRLAAELVEASPVLFIDNANGMTLNSSALASVMTEQPARVRILGQTKMALLNSSAFVVATGNALAVSEDLARRFIECRLDAKCEDPEARPFPPGFLEEIARARQKLLAAALTIWRWGRINAGEVVSGKPLGSFETWSEWCRDPLLALGCSDPVVRIADAKYRDPRRQETVELFKTWWECHRDRRVKASDLDQRVTKIIDPKERGRQFVAWQLGKLSGTTVGGFVLTSHKGLGKWSHMVYALQKNDPQTSDDPEHRGHRGHRGTGTEDAADPAPDTTSTVLATVDL
jgi:hypothetical protein